MDTQLGAHPLKVDVLRGIIPSYDSIGTKYLPARDYLMVVPLPTTDKVGEIILPDRSRIVYSEGHVVARGRATSGNIKLGDCVTWSPHADIPCEIDGKRFTLIQEANVIMFIPGPAWSDHVHSNTTPEGEGMAAKLDLSGIVPQSPQEVCNELADLGLIPEVDSEHE